MVRLLASSLLASALLAGFSQAALALDATSAPAADVRCAATAIVSPNLPAAQGALATSKSAAILGGVSALERIRLEQAAQAAATPPTPDKATLLVQALPPLGETLAPGSGPSPCSRLVLPRVAPAFSVAPGIVSRLPGSDDFLQTRRLAVGHTAFDRDWGRVSHDTVSRGFLARQAGLRELAATPLGIDTLSAVNAWTNRSIRYVEDAKLFHKADYWAGAPTTLRLRAGDCEDIAITKLQLLAALGVPRSDMYLTIARDLARHADHALLVVRMGGHHWLLDNATDRVLDAAESYDYQPVLSFSQGHAWLHGAVLASAN